VLSVTKTTAIGGKDIIIGGISKIGDVGVFNSQLLLLLVLADITELYKIKRIV
jgi:hypothetical protein